MAQLALSFQVRPPPHPRGTCRKEADGHPHPPTRSASALERKLLPADSTMLTTHEHLLWVPVPLLLCTPHTSANSPLECQTVLSLLLPIHLAPFTLGFGPCPCS